MPLIYAWIGFGVFTIVASVLVALNADRLSHRGRLRVMSNFFEHVLHLPLGFHTGVVQSLTYEEANTQLGNWLSQRSRWLKGFMQTWLVHMRNPLRTVRELGPSGFWSLQALTAGIFFSALFHPFLLALSLWAFVVNPPYASVATMLLAGLNLEVFVLGYGVAMLAGAKALRQRGLKGWWFTIATMPIYWLLMSIAAWMALWQFIFTPFRWNKTEHGLSKLQA
jgi:cellulose synthase/poly-beta-1,6-N-acetylglucosamine synthase-like glycosyltransferase